MQPEMIEEEIDVEGLTPDLPDFERHLAADEGEPAATLQEKVTKMFEEATLELPLSGGRAHGQKLKRIWIFENLSGQVGILCRQRSGKVGEGLPYPFQQLGRDVMSKNVAAPAVVDGRSQVR